MPETITFRGSTIWSDAAGGVGYKMRLGSPVPQVVEVPSELGVGVWLKPANTSVADHVLELQWVTATPSTPRAAILALAGITRGTLVVPSHGTLTNLRLYDVSDWDQTPIEGGYALRVALTFREDP